MWNANGILIQGLDEKTGFVKNFSYHGVNAFYQFPLVGVNDKESRKLTNEQQSKQDSDGLYLMLEFISNHDLFIRYLKRCNELQMETRALFVESEYSEEIWQGELPEMMFIGYEYCSIPIDQQIITDLDWYKPFSKFWNKLNKYGLFDLYDDVLEFMKEYHREMDAGNIGDGEIDAYIFRVYQIIL